jgi:hypothetical protein
LGDYRLYDRAISYHCERKKKKIGGKKRSRIEAGVLIDPYEEKQKILVAS